MPSLFRCESILNVPDELVADADIRTRISTPPHRQRSGALFAQLVDQLHVSDGMAFLGDAEQDAGKNTQGKITQGEDVQEKDAQGKNVQEKEIRTCQRIRLETSTWFIPGNRFSHLDYLHLAGTLNPAHYLYLAGLPKPLSLRIPTPMELSHPPSILSINGSLCPGSVYCSIILRLYTNYGTGANANQELPANSMKTPEPSRGS